MTESRKQDVPRRLFRTGLTEQSSTQSSSFSEPPNVTSIQGHRLMSRIVCLAVAVTAASFSLGFSGCCSSGCGGGGIGGFIDGFMEKQVSCMRDHVWAKRAFHVRYGHCERVHADHFKTGFLAGYGNICQGHSGECPPVPPQKYWSYQYRNDDGVAMQEAWFAGFEAGAGAAKNDGASTYQEIQISRELEEAMASAQAIDEIHGGLSGLAEGEEQIVPGSIVTVDPNKTNNINSPSALKPFVNQPSTSISRTEIINGNTPLALPPMPVPMTNTSSNNMPLPAKIVPAQVPIIPGNKRN